MRFESERLDQSFGKANFSASFSKRSDDADLVQAGGTIVPHCAGLDVGARGCHAMAEFPTSNGPADFAIVSGGRTVG